MSKFRRALPIVVACAALGTGCSSTDGEVGTSTTLSPAQQIVSLQPVADMLVKNHEAKTAAFVGELPYGPVVFSYNGAVNWDEHLGHVIVETVTDGETTETTELVFGLETVLVRNDALAEISALAGNPPANWVGYPLDPEASPMNVVLTVILGLSALKADNPAILADDGVVATGTATIAGVDTTIFDAGKATYWVGNDDGLLHKLKAELASSGTLSLTFSGWGKQDIPNIESDAVLTFEQVAQMYPDFEL